MVPHDGGQFIETLAEGCDTLWTVQIRNHDILISKAFLPSTTHSAAVNVVREQSHQESDHGPVGKAPKRHFSVGLSMTSSVGGSSVIVVAESRETKANESSKCRTVEDVSQRDVTDL